MAASNTPEPLWSASAWNAALPIYEKILVHPFVNELASGTLPYEKFLFYIAQDALYLEGYSKAMAAIAVRLPHQHQRDIMVDFIKDFISEEQAMQETYFKLNGGRPSAEAVKPTPSCELYISYIMKIAAAAPVEVAAAVILPCYWIYLKVGQHLLSIRTKENNPYDAWIDTYADESFDTATTQAITLCDELAEQSTGPVRDFMTEVYVAASRMEWMFWDSAYRMEQWPV